MLLAGANEIAAGAIKVAPVAGAAEDAIAADYSGVSPAVLAPALSPPSLWNKASVVESET